MTTSQDEPKYKIGDRVRVTDMNLEGDIVNVEMNPVLHQWTYTIEYYHEADVRSTIGCHADALVKVGD